MDKKRQAEALARAGRALQELGAALVDLSTEPEAPPAETSKARKPRARKVYPPLEVSETDVQFARKHLR